MDKQNYYDFLGVAKEADEKDIINAIKKIQQSDKDGRHQSLLLTIKRTLTDEHRRKIYDRLIAHASPLNAHDNVDDVQVSKQPLVTNHWDKNPKEKPANKNSQHEFTANSANHFNDSSPSFVDTEKNQRAYNGSTHSEQTSPLPTYHKDRLTAAWLAFLGGGLGLHRFWLGETTIGIIYLIINFLTGGLVSIAAMIEAILIYKRSNASWKQQYSHYASNYPGKDKHAATILAFFSGFIGGHRYYLNQWKIGFLYSMFAWTFIPFIAGIIEGVIYLQTSDKEWNSRYGKVKNEPAGCFSVLLIPMALIIDMIVILIITA